MYRLPEFLQSALESGATIVTADPRQAFAIRFAWAEHQQQRGRSVWHTPNVLPLSAWLTSTWSHALGSEQGVELPALLSPVQERMLWERVVHASAFEREFLHPHGAARAALRSWQRLHDGGIDLRALEPGAGEETRAFLTWSAQASRQMHDRRWIDRPRALWRCPIAKTPVAEINGSDSEFMLLGFDVEPPAHRELLRRLEARGVKVRHAPTRAALAKVSKLGCPDLDGEVYAAACWARRRLERNPEERLLIAIPDLERRRGQVERVLADVLDPISLLVSAPPRTATFACEEIIPLVQYPIVATALTALELAAQPLPFDQVSRWLRSPYLLAGRAQAPQRARLDMALRRVAAEELDLQRLIAAVVSSRPNDADHALLEGLRRLAEHLRRPARMPAEWSVEVSTALTLIGWPGDRSLDSAEFQTLEKFHAALGELATLDGFLGRVNLREAVRSLRQLLEQTPFQPEAGNPPVTVTSRIGDPVLVYDGIWVSGLHAGAWPQPPRPDPFIPWSIQVSAGFPEATAAGQLERARQTLALWAASSTEMIVSWPQRLDDEDFDPSPLIAAFPTVAAEVAAPTTRPYAGIIHASARIERVVDEIAPPLPPGARPLGARTLRLQSLCPFRAFAEQRLGARPVEQPEPGIDARTRGSFIHRALEQLWSSLGDGATLRNASPEDRAALIDAAMDSARREVLERRRRWSAATVALETERLRGLLHTWLGKEAEREPFRVLAMERELECTIGGVPFRLRIDRLDELADGRLLLIDYKSGEADAGDWFDERPEDPQMPLYAYALVPQPAALAYAVLSADGCRFEGVSAPPVAVADLKPLPDWRAQFSAWQAVIEGLTSEFAAGRAHVDPKPMACTTCHLHSLCRIDELIARASREDGDE